jgi:hypothetical protein
MPAAPAACREIASPSWHPPTIDHLLSSTTAPYREFLRGYLWS